MLFPPGRWAASAVIAGIDWAIRNVATPARTSRMRIPAPVALPEKSRSPIRRTVRRGGACEVVVTPAPGGSARSVREGAARWKARGVVDAPGHRSAGPDHWDVIASTAFWLLPRVVSEIGEEPAWSAAAFWPSSLIT